MPTAHRRILVTGANGQLGQLILDGLLQKVAADQVVAMVRSDTAAVAIRERGVDVRQADFDAPQSLDAAFAGIDTLMLVSSSAFEGRLAQHRNAIDAAHRAGVGLIAYTSILHADSSPLALAVDHLATENVIRASGIPYVLLRNGWYTENYSGSAGIAVANGTVFGSAGSGRISLASRADYAAAAVAVLTSSHDDAGRVYELAGDSAITLAEFADELARQSGRPVRYQNLPETEYRVMLEQIGLPAILARLLADSDIGASKGGLLDDSGTLSELIGRPTTPLAHTVAAVLAGARPHEASIG